MSLEGVGLLAEDSSRTRAYLDAMLKNDLAPAYAILLTGDPDISPPALPAVPFFENRVPALETIRLAGVPFEVIRASDPNAPKVVHAVRCAPGNVIVYSGPGGAILRGEMLGSGKRFLHVHPGLMPFYRGSTTVYYSLLVDGTCGATAFFLNERIDEGPVLAQQVYPAPVDRTTIDHGYDPFIRSDLLVRVLDHYRRTGDFRPYAQDTAHGETYYIIHPVLRHIAVLTASQVSGRDGPERRAGDAGCA